MEYGGNLDFLGPVLQVCLIDLFLSGDNAIVIALACRALPEDVRRKAVLFGTGAAIVFRVLLTSVATLVLKMPLLKLAGAVALLAIAIRLLAGKHHSASEDAREGHTLWSAIGVIVIADTVMSFDNVVAVAAAAEGSLRYLFLGLLISIPILIFGSLWIIRVLNRNPVLILAGGALLGWVAGSTAISDSLVSGWIESQSFGLAAAAPLLGAIYVVLQSWLMLGGKFELGVGGGEPRLALRAAGPGAGPASGEAGNAAAIAVPRSPTAAPVVARTDEGVPPIAAPEGGA
ncbi:MAG TPA: TerC family protein, partial [Burkholderiaceae bacterium]